MTAVIRDLDAWRMAYSGADAAGVFSSTSIDEVMVELPEITPPSTAKPLWLIPTANRLAELYYHHHGHRSAAHITSDTINFAFTMLTQSLPPTAPPPSVSMLAGSGIDLAWDTEFGLLRLEFFEPNRVRLINADTVVNARLDFREVGDLLWERLGSQLQGSTLEQEIERLSIEAPLDSDAAAQAQSAKADAIAFANREFPNSRPHIAISDDGVVTLQWQDSAEGLLLVFIGDNTVTYSIKQPETSYSLNAREIDLSSSLPDDARAVIYRIEEDVNRDRRVG